MVTKAKQAEADKTEANKGTGAGVMPEASPTKKRQVLSDQERIAKLEADLRAAREKAADKAKTKVTELEEKKGKLVEKRDKLSSEITEIETEVERLNALRGVDDPIAAANDRANTQVEGGVAPVSDQANADQGDES